MKKKDLGLCFIDKEELAIKKSDWFLISKKLSFWFRTNGPYKSKFFYINF